MALLDPDSNGDCAPAAVHLPKLLVALYKVVSDPESFKAMVRADCKQFSVRDLTKFPLLEDLTP